jgi:signal transduction histidine kinase
MGPARWRATALRYAGAVVVITLVVLGRLAMDPIWGRQSNRHLVFIPTVMLVSWFGGLGPGLLAAGSCTLAISYFWMEPIHQMLHASSDLLLFFVIGAAIAGLFESLRRARAHATGAARSREQVLAVVAHDLRNPLATIKMTLTALEGATPDAETLRHRLSVIERASSRMENLIRDLVDATRIEHGGLELKISDERVESIAHETLEVFTPLARERGVALEADVAASAAVVACDRERVLQVLANLVGNALRFTPEGGRITLRAAEQDGHVRFEVGDTGPGIRAEDLPHIFEQYWNSDRKGTGLGLFIAQSLVRAHGGALGVDTKPGSGARFYFSLPRQARAISARPEEAPA